MKAKHQRTLDAINSRPTRANIKWNDVISLFVAMGAYIEEREGSRVCVDLEDRIMVLHKPHQKEINKSTVNDLRSFLEEVG